MIEPVAIALGWLIAIALFLPLWRQAMNLFDYVPARTTDPHTSHDAAKSIESVTMRIRRAVEDFAIDKGSSGFTDWEMDSFFGCFGSTYRTRRAELTKQGIIVPTHQRRATPSGRTAVVWRHRDFKGN